MSAPTKVLSFQKVDKCVEFGMFFKILPKRQEILDSLLPIEVILRDSESKKEYPAELTDVISIHGIIIPSLFAKLSDNLDAEEMENHLKVKFPNLETHDFALFTYTFKK